MGPAHVDRAASRHQRLGGHLAAEDALTVLIGAHAPKDVDFDGLEIEKVDQKIEVFAHPSILTWTLPVLMWGPHTRPTWADRSAHAG